jgi:phenylalanyl-tRNA synthetase beta chain
MRISLDWLNDFVDVDVPLKDLVDRLAMIGFLAEEVVERDGNAVLDIETYANRPDTLDRKSVV